MSRKLATIQKIKDIQPIEGADRIEVATVNGWKVVVAKDVGHEVGDLVVYCEIDSFLPIREEFEFLRKSSYKKLADETEGFRLKTVKLRGQVSQGLILPLTVFHGYGYDVAYGESDVILIDRDFNVDYKFFIGDDVSDELDIVKYDPPLPPQLTGTAKGYFPSFIPKTDEERIQNLSDEFEEWKNSDLEFYATEKLDGTSTTYYIKDGVFGVCSRNLELLEDEDNTLWRVARKLDLEDGMRALGGNFSIQGELIGEGIQGNPYKIKGQTFRAFTGFDIDTQERIKFHGMRAVLNRLGVSSVPYVHMDFKLPETIDELLEMAEGKSVLNDETEREGLVIRSKDQSVSFKVISNKFLLNED